MLLPQDLSHSGGNLGVEGMDTVGSTSCYLERQTKVGDIHIFKQ